MAVTFQASAYGFKQCVSKSIALGEGTITSATMLVAVTSTGPYSANFYLSADGGANWEEVTPNVNHVFTNSGTDLRWKITGSGPFRVTKVTVDYA